MGMEALGRLFNVQYVMDDVYVNMRDVGGVAFVGYLSTAADTFTLTEAKTAAGGSSQVLATITKHWECTGDGTDAWVLTTLVANSAYAKGAGASASQTLFHVTGEELSAGYDFVKCTSTGAAIVIAITYDLKVQRNPVNLPAMGV